MYFCFRLTVSWNLSEFVILEITRRTCNTQFLSARAKCMHGQNARTRQFCDELDLKQPAAAGKFHIYK